VIALVRFRRADSIDISHLKDFLRANSLPTVGLEDWYTNFFIALDDEDSWVAVAGYEVYNQTALLRSVAVDKRSRGLGRGRALVEAVLADARKRGVQTVYLLTETAEPYFKRLGFDPIDRDRIEQAVKNSEEFKQCCGTAQAMRRTL
jgi:amino-acid N-acetyltransferase